MDRPSPSHRGVDLLADWRMASAVALVLAGLAVVVALNVVARRAAVPSAVLLVLAGLMYAVLPGPNLTLQPNLVLEVVIPPLLYAAALNSSAIELRRNVRAVGSLSVGLVLATSLAVAGVVSTAVSSVPFAAAVALGAAVAPTDPVAALAVGRPGGLPARLIRIVEGEGLLNDATALTVLQVATAAVVSGRFSVIETLGRFALASVGGVISGLVVANGLAAVRRRLHDPLADNALSLGTPFAAFLLADSFGGSGVLAVVVAGLWFAHRGPSIQSGESRLQSRAVWSLVEYILEGFVFLLIGQQLPAVIRGLHEYSTGTLVIASLATAGMVLVVRPVWLLLNEVFPARMHTRLGGTRGHDHDHLSGREVAALSWTGTRGVITLAAAFSMPLTVHGGASFPGRNLLLLCAYVCVLVTLVPQGVALAPLLHRLNFRDPSSGDALLRNQARASAVEAALARLDQLTDKKEVPQEVAEALRRAANIRLDRYSSRIDRLSNAEDTVLAPDDPYFAAVRARRSMIDAERDELLQWRDAGRLPEDSLRILQRELDHEEGLLPPA